MIFEFPKNKELLLDYLDKLSDKFAYNIVIKKKLKKRSLNQNSYLHFAINMIAKETGNSLEDLKEYFKQTFGQKKEVAIGDEVILLNVSTTDYSVEQMTQFIQNVINFAQYELGIYIPNMDDRYAELFYLEQKQEI